MLSGPADGTKTAMLLTGVRKGEVEIVGKLVEMGQGATEIQMRKSIIRQMLKRE